jgi:NADPH:quinone reductase-like Zn-dependent oxidoreductase
MMKMKAVVFTKYGGPEVLKIREVKRPEPKENQVLIKVKAALVTPTDCVFGKGTPFISRVFTGLAKPRRNIPGEIFGGIVVKTGSKVTRFNVGDDVYGSTGSIMGAYAEYICIDDDSAIVRKPEIFDFGTAAGICDGGLTAYGFLKGLVDIKKGQHILINGASGSVGSFAVQIAKYFGGVVTGVCSAKNVELVKNLGADYVIDYTKEDFTKSNQKYDVVFDVVVKSSFSKCKDVLTDNGVYLTTFPNPGVLLNMLFKKSGKRAKFAATGLKKNPEKVKTLNILNEMVENGYIKEVVDRKYVMQEATDAFRYVAKGHKRGNVILTI